MLAWLRAHYPEHQHKKEEGRRKKNKKDKQPHPHHTPHHIPPFHNPQHNTTRQDMHCRHNKVVCRQYPPHHTHTTFLPNTNHHPYSTMTQPCHKDTPLNQQCCDSRHNACDARRERQEDRNTRKDKTHPALLHHTAHGETQSHSIMPPSPATTALPHPQHTKKKREQDNTRRAEQRKGAGPNPKTRHHNNTPLAIQ